MANNKLLPKTNRKRRQRDIERCRSTETIRQRGNATVPTWTRRTRVAHKRNRRKTKASTGLTTRTSNRRGVSQVQAIIPSTPRAHRHRAPLREDYYWCLTRSGGSELRAALGLSDCTNALHHSVCSLTCSARVDLSSDIGSCA